jgi:hypothetical protein
MTDTTRRGFLAVAGVGAAGVAAAAVVGSGSNSATEPETTTKAGTELPAGASGSLVAYVNDVRDGHVSVLVGEREVVIRDKELVARLANAVAK